METTYEITEADKKVNALEIFRNMTITELQAIKAYLQSQPELETVIP